MGFTTPAKKLGLAAASEMGPRVEPKAISVDSPDRKLNHPAESALTDPAS
jgi:hypothetical protein